MIQGSIMIRGMYFFICNCRKSKTESNRTDSLFHKSARRKKNKIKN